MNFLMYLRRLERDLLKLLLRREQRPKISLLIPYQKVNPQRDLVFRWLVRYWQNELPEAEIIVGRSFKKPFCKTEAFNHAVARARGRVLVLLDADAYLSGEVINKCADRILEGLDDHLWYVPYRHLFRLNKRITQEIIESDPSNPLRLSTPPSSNDTDTLAHKSGYGHRYGAMIMILPREAIDVLGCFDERFKGWGGEDIAILRALDTLYGKHKTTNNAIFHLWHPVIGTSYKSRMWVGQSKQYNNRLANAYHKATRNPSQMRKLVDEGCKEKHRSVV